MMCQMIGADICSMWKDYINGWNIIHLFLLIINELRPFDEFDDEAFTRVLALSNLWIAKIASGIYMDHLLKSENSTVKEKYLLAEVYKLEDYESKLIANIKTKEELASIVQNDQIKLDQATKDELFQKRLELLGISNEAQRKEEARRQNQRIRGMEEEMSHFEAQRDAQGRENDERKEERLVRHSYGREQFVDEKMKQLVLDDLKFIFVNPKVE
ncbi:unnamed protein product [Caenorhabditis brenneri]